MSCFSKAIKDGFEFKSLLAAVENNRLPAGVIGLSNIHKAHYIHSLCVEQSRKALIVVPDEAQAVRLVQDLNAFQGGALLYPAREFSLHGAEGQSREFEHQRIGVLSKILEDEYSTVVCSIEAAMQFTLPPKELLKRSIKMKQGDEISLNKIISVLIASGYVGAEQVEGNGQYAVRGGILDFFPPDSGLPVRIEFWGDTIDSISVFEVESQRRTDSIQEVQITPSAEVLFDNEAQLAEKIEQLLSTVKGKGSVKVKENLLSDLDKIRSNVRLSSADKYLQLAYPQPATIFDYTENAVLFVSETAAVKDSANNTTNLFYEDIKLLMEEGRLCKGLGNFMLTFNEVLARFEDQGAVYMDSFPRGSFDTPVRELINVTAQQLPLWNGSISVLLEDLHPALNAGFTCVVMAGTEKSAKSLAEDLENEGVKAIYFMQPPGEFPKNRISVLSGGLSAGMEYTAMKFTVYSYGHQAAPTKKLRRTKKNAHDQIHSLEELRKGDYIVHSTHGIGIFDGIQNLEVSGVTKDYIKIKYAKQDVLYVPVTQLDLVSKYIGPKEDGKVVKLNRLGSSEWQKAKSKVRAAVTEMAQGLIELYSKRLNSKGYSFSPDMDMQNDFERRFEYEETEDQLRCIDEIKGDMEKPYPMDRLLCGDVGFGKTEVALRAVFKCVADGKQCAILVPTTILAFQHYQTILKRFEGFPIEAEMLSRFRTPQQQEKIVAGLRRGSIDIIVGTHRLISKDIKFKDLGLIVVDEEQRFGVIQKERLKEMFPAVDVVSLSATPIPRTLNMAMMGIRDMSILEEAPQDRHPVQTYVLEHDMGVLAQAIRKELRRNGQVYYVHNRVETIARAANIIHELVPEARIGIAHGKMTEEVLSDTWRKLLDGEIDVLVCTTIIETGIDVHNVNTLIIEDADKMGLAQLHQMRGRVGRSTRRASAYFTFTRGRELTEIATHRLNAIREYTEFGSGFKIAMRDLELRGAGNVLGTAQHGHMEAVGYDMYLKLLAQAVRQERGDTDALPEKDCLVDLQIEAHIPEKYIESVPQRLAIYRRIADIHSDADAEDVIDELIDRFGEPPSSVIGLIDISLLRNIASQQGIYEISQRAGCMLLYYSTMDMQKVARLSHVMRGKVLVSAGAKPYISVKMMKNQSPLNLLREVLKILSLESKNKQEQ